MKSRILFQLGRFLTTILGLVLLIMSSQTIAAEVRPQTLLYQVDHRGSDAGQLEVVIEKMAKGYLVRSISHLSTLASLFLKNTTIVSRWKQVGDSVELVGGEEVLNESGKVKRSFSIDVAKRQINFAQGEPIRYQKGMPVEADGFPLWLMMNGPTAIEGRDIISVSPKRARLYHYEQSVTAEISVPAGNYSAVKLQGIRQDNANKSIQIWLRSATDPIPVKIVTGEPGKFTTLSLLK